MTGDVRVIWDEELTSYDPGPGHPLRPIRLDLTIELARRLGVLDRPGVSVAAPARADDDLLQLVHDPAYIGYVKRAPQDAGGRLAAFFGLGTLDNPVFDRMHESAALVTGASVEAARAVWQGGADHAVNIAGGLHHAMRSSASGFCVYDDPAVAIAWLLAAGAGKVAYVDVDVHHGDGVQAAFYDNPRVLTISLHESGRSLFPGTGWPTETGDGEAVGTSVNVALPAGTADAGWLRAFDAVVPPLLRAFSPDVLLTQHGCDTHALDPLAHLQCTVDGQRAAYSMLHALAHEVCGGRWVAVGGGGYELLQVVPRAWTHLLAEATGEQISGGTPDDWREYATGRMAGGSRAVEPPSSLSDGSPPSFTPWSQAGSTGDAVDRAIAATRDAVFPAHGLAP
jgi:acetoin utilization protein AcuC